MKRLVKNVGKRILNVPLRLRQVEIQERNQFALTCSTAELVSRQIDQGGFVRLDLFIAYLAIKEAEGRGSKGIGMLGKLLDGQPQGLVAYRALYSIAKRGSVLEAFYNAPPMVVTQSLDVINSFSAVALALHAELDRVPVIMKPGSSPERHDEQWLLSRGFSLDEITLVNSARDEVFDKLGLSSIPWERLDRIRNELRSYISKRGKTLHGRGGFYQSCKELLIEGQRPTEDRFEAYGIQSELKMTDRVLDIGCNCGFFALHVSKFVQAVDAFDIDSEFISIATAAKNHLGRANCNFYRSGFEEFVPPEKYDLILSFAVHHWINLQIRVYVEKLLSMLRPGGLVLVETQDLNTHDLDWAQKLDEFQEGGLQILRKGSLCDDGILVREYVLFRDARSDLPRR